MRTKHISCLGAVVFLALNLQAQPTDSWRPAANPAYWNIPANWSLTFLPGFDPAPGYKADFNSSSYGAAFVTNAVGTAQLVIGDNGPGNVIIANGGSLVTSNFIAGNSWNALGYNSIARLEVQNGGSVTISNHLWIGQNPNANATLIMNGGTMNVLGMFGLGWSGSARSGLGMALINGGTLNLAQWDSANSISALSQMDIRSGSVIITGDYTASVNAFIAGGQITGYGGSGTASCRFDSVNNQTIITATPTVGAGGPYPATDWPTNINPNRLVHYYVADGTLSAPNANWVADLGIKNDGDQTTTDVTYQGLLGKKATSNNLNVWDNEWQAWNTNGLIDILLCVYGDASVLRSASDSYQARRFQFLTGTLPTDGASTVYGGTFSTNAYNSQWNWILFTITNNLQSNQVDRLIGTLRTNATGGTNFGGINGGTIRIQGPDSNVNGLTVHAVAFGQHGAFGTRADINQFALPNGSCPPVINVNLAAVDYNAGYTNHLQVINDPGTGQGVTYATGIGPADDKRNAVIPTGNYLNFDILNNYLGQPCNDNVPMKVCVDYYDDPAFAGGSVMFGPQAYATDSLGDLASLPMSAMAVLQGTGRWIHQSWTIPSVNLLGVSTTPLTGGPQFVALNGNVAVSRCYIGVLRATGPLAGMDPLADCYGDPQICQGVYGNYAELDLANGITNGLGLGTSSGDQSFVVENAGPTGDQRLSVRPDASPGYYLNFQILTNALGPTSQGNLHLAMVATYYDDPVLAGQGFRPQVWKSQGILATGFNYMNPPQNMVLQGTGTWRDAYWEIGTISLDGVNQSPQAAARFECDSPIHFSRLRYWVIRPCGPTAGQNPLASKVNLVAAPETNSLVKLSWPYRAPQAVLESSATLNGPWTSVSGTPAIESGEQAVLRLSPANANNLFFRLTITPP